MRKARLSNAETRILEQFFWQLGTCSVREDPPEGLPEDEARFAYTTVQTLVYRLGAEGRPCEK